MVGLEDVNPLKEQWAEWMPKIIEVAKSESISRPLIRKMLQQMETKDTFDSMNGKAMCITRAMLKHSKASERM